VGVLRLSGLSDLVRRGARGGSVSAATRRCGRRTEEPRTVVVRGPGTSAPRSPLSLAAGQRAESRRPSSARRGRPRMHIDQDTVVWHIRLRRMRHASVSRQPLSGTATQLHLARRTRVRRRPADRDLPPGDDPAGRRSLPRHAWCVSRDRRDAGRSRADHRATSAVGNGEGPPGAGGPSRCGSVGWVSRSCLAQPLGRRGPARSRSRDRSRARRSPCRTPGRGLEARRR